MKYSTYKKAGSSSQKISTLMISTLLMAVCGSTSAQATSSELQNNNYKSISLLETEAMQSATATMDFDNDGRAELVLRRPATFENIYRRSGDAGTSKVIFGRSLTDIPVSGDFDGDGITDIAVRRPDSNIWYIRNSSGVDGITGHSDGITRLRFGRQVTDIPVPADYDGDGKTDIAVRRPSNSTWYIRNSSGVDNITGFGDGITRRRFGLQEADIPVPADYDGDGKADIAVRRPGNATWYILNSSGVDSVTSFNDGITRRRFGLQAADIPVPADYDGDGQADLAVRRASNSTWYILNSSGIDNMTGFSDGITRRRFGLQASDIPAVADYDGDGKDDIAVRRPVGARWFILNSSGTDPLDENNDAISRTLQGREGDIPLAQPLMSLWNGSDIDADGLSKSEEDALGTDYTNADSDSDGISDGEEVNQYNTDPLNSDTDGDGLSDGEEVETYNTDPNDADSDDDGVNDGDEVGNGTDPNDGSDAAPVGFTADMVSNIEGYLTTDKSAGFITYMANVLTFSEEMTGVEYTNSTVTSSTRKQAFEWQISDDNNLVFLNSNTVTYFASLCNDNSPEFLASSGFSQEVVNEVARACGLGFLDQQITIENTNSDRTWELTQRQANTLFINQTSTTTIKLFIPQEVIDNIPDGWQVDAEPVGQSVSEPVAYQFKVGVDEGITAPDLTGDWILPLRYTLHVPPRFSDGVASTGFAQDRFTFTSENDTLRATSLLGGNQYSVTVTDEGFVLSAGDETFSYSLLEQLDHQYTVSVTYSVAGTEEHIYLATMNQVNNTAETFLSSLVTELPEVYNASINAVNASKRENGLPVLDNLFAYQFNADNTFRRGIFGYSAERWSDIAPDSDQAAPFFQLNVPEWSYEIDSEQNIINTRYSTPNFPRLRNRVWHVLNVNSAGIATVFEYAIWTDDTDRDGEADTAGLVIEPRINFMEKVDLSQYTTAWGNSDADNDGLTNAQEEELGTNLFDADSDDDGLSDSEEVNTYNTDPNDADSDDDGVNDGEEVGNGTDPNDPDDSVPTGFTTNMLNGLEGYTTVENAPGFVTISANAYQFNNDFTAVRYTNRLPTTSTSKETIGWEITGEGGLRFLDSSSFSYFTFICGNSLLENNGFSTEVVAEINRACGLDLLNQQIEVQSITDGRTWSLTESQDNALSVEEITTTTTRLIIPQSVIDDIEGGWLVAAEPEGQVTSDPYAMQFKMAPDSGISQPELVGDWVLPVRYTLHVAPRFSDGTPNTGFSQDRFTFSNDNGSLSATSQLGQNQYDVTTTDTGFVLTNGNETFAYTLMEQFEDQYTVSVRYEVSDELEQVYVASMSQANASAENFLSDIVTDLPEVYNSSINAVYANQRETNGLPDIDGLFAYQFNSDGIFKRGIFGYSEETWSQFGDPGQPAPFFRFATQDWNYEIDENTNIIDTSYTFTNFPRVRNRIWQILNVNSSGVVSVLEYAIWTEDTDNDGVVDTDGLFIEPRINYFEKLDLEDYGEAYGNSDVDNDGLTNNQEEALGTDPMDADSDDDGLLDGAEVNNYGTDPNDSDSDDDGSNDGEEVEAGSDPLDPGSFPVPFSSIDFADDELKRCITDNHSVTYASEITELRCFSNYNITSLGGLENLSGLERLELYGNFSSPADLDLTPLTGLTTLTWLTVWDFAVTDIAPVAGLVKLTRLIFNSSNFSDASPIANLVELDSLWIQSHQTTLDISGLTGLSKLTDFLGGLSTFTSLDVVANWTELTRFSCIRCGLSDIDFLSGLSDLESLTVDTNSISSIALIENLPNLTSINISNTQVTDISLIRARTTWEYLSVSNLGLSDADITFLENQTNLRSFVASYNTITDIPALINMLQGKPFTQLFLSGNGISDITGIDSLAQLDNLVMASNDIRDVTPLVGMTRLWQLSLRNNNNIPCSQLEELRDSLPNTSLQLPSECIDGDSGGFGYVDLQPSTDEQRAPASVINGACLPANSGWETEIVTGSHSMLTCANDAMFDREIRVTDIEQHRISKTLLPSFDSRKFVEVKAQIGNTLTHPD